MNIWEFAKRMGLIGKYCVFLFLLSLILPMRAGATDCNTDCSDACLTSWRYPCGIGWCDETVTDPACKVRCDAEKALSCETGLNFCDLERIANPSQWDQIKEVLQLATDAQVIRSHNHCLDIVSGAGGAVSVADLILQFGLPPGTVSLAQHSLSCICGAVNYGTNPSDNDPIAPPDGGSPGITQYAIDQTIFEIYRNVYQREPSNKELVWAREAFGRGLSSSAVRAAVITRAINDIYAHVYGKGPSEVNLARGFTDFERGLPYTTIEEKVIVEKRRKQVLLMLLGEYMTAGL